MLSQDFIPGGLSPEPGWSPPQIWKISQWSWINYRTVGSVWSQLHLYSQGERHLTTNLFIHTFCTFSFSRRIWKEKPQDYLWGVGKKLEEKEIFILNFISFCCLDFKNVRQYWFTIKILKLGSTGRGVPASMVHLATPMEFLECWVIFPLVPQGQ